jgi:uncharacterized coiled-coil protein SlyX
MTDHGSSGTGGTEGTGGIPKPVHDLVVQMRGLTERLAGLTGLTGLTGMAGMVESLPGANMLPSLPRPASLSAAQLKAVSSTVAAQRRSIEAMQAQLRAFDEQLTVMEQILEPVTEWATVWADLEETVRGRPSAPDE